MTPLQRPILQREEGEQALRTQREVDRIIAVAQRKPTEQDKSNGCGHDQSPRATDGRTFPRAINLSLGFSTIVVTRPCLAVIPHR
jgi:hypothetical protein